MKITAFLLLLPFALFAQDGFEIPPTLSAATILKPEFAVGAGFTVRDDVPTYGGRNSYTIDSDAGVFEADGSVMLMRRVREVSAIAKLREVSRTDEYAKVLRLLVFSPNFTPTAARSLESRRSAAFPSPSPPMAA